LSQHVVGLPKINNHPSNQHVRMNSTASFNCGATGVGILTYYWSKDGIIINKNTLNNNTQELIIQNAGVKDSGLYQCHVKNEDDLIANSSTAELLGIKLPYYHTHLTSIFHIQLVL